MQCRFCGTEIHEKPGGHRARQYCSDRCKTAYFRRLKAPTPAAQPGDRDLAQVLAAAQTRIVDLERDLASAEERLQAAQDRMVKMAHRLDVERRFLLDSQQYNFKAWLRKQRDLPEVGKKMLQDEWLEPQERRRMYTVHMRQAEYTPEEIAEFENLWRVMLLDRS